MAKKSPKKSKLGFSFEAQKFIYQIPNDAFIFKSMATTKNSAKMNKNVQNADRQVMRIKIAKIK